MPLDRFNEETRGALGLSAAYIAATLLSFSGKRHWAVLGMILSTRRILAIRGGRPLVESMVLYAACTKRSARRVSSVSRRSFISCLVLQFLYFGGRFAVAVVPSVLA